MRTRASNRTGTGTMVQDKDRELWAAIDAQRIRVAELLEGLSDEEWEHPSLCAAWTVREVAAHLALQQLTPPRMFKVLVQNPGGLNTIIRKAAIRKALEPKENFAVEIRAMVGSRIHNVGVTPKETLTDILVHGQDIAAPLGRDLEMPVEPTRWAADRVWSRRRTIDTDSVTRLTLKEWWGRFSSLTTLTTLS